MPNRVKENEKETCDKNSGKVSKQLKTFRVERISLK